MTARPSGERSGLSNRPVRGIGGNSLHGTWHTANSWATYQPRAVTIQELAASGAITPSAESELEELRWGMLLMRRSPVHRGHCIDCDPQGKRRSELNGQGLCRNCWRRSSGFLLERRKNDNRLAEVDPIEAGWTVAYDNGPGLVLKATGQPAHTAKPDAWIFYLSDEWLAIKPAIRPWRRRPWQETPIGRPWVRTSLLPRRNGVGRIDVLNADTVNSDTPYKGDGIHYKGLVIRCLVCLGPPEAFRPRHDEDQACRACDRAWRRACEQGTDYDAFVQKRRVNYRRKNPGAHLVALDRAVQLAQVVQARPKRSPRSNRPYYKVVVRAWDNRSVDKRAGNVSFSHAWADDITVPNGWKRPTWDATRIVPEQPPATLEDWQDATIGPQELEPASNYPPGHLATITDIDTRRSEAAVS